jgi:putative tryptophan/tyrosine transport system substrate-binding protein
MRRRTFIRLLSMAAAGPFAARAQQPMPVVGFLSARSPEESAHLVTAFRKGMSEAGAIEGQNVLIEYRWALGKYDRLPELAAELVRRPVALLATVGGDPSALAAKAATTTIPIVSIFTADPVDLGVVGSLGRPGGNVTGMSILNGTLEAKRLGLLHDLLPQATTLGFLLNPAYPSAARQLSNMRDAAGAVGVQLDISNASTDSEIETVFESIAERHIPGLVVAVDSLFAARRDKFVELAKRHAMPAMYSLRDFTAAGGLMSYGVDLPDMYRQIGVYAGRVLKGASPADLPITQPTKFELVINLKTAKSLGLSLAPGLLAIADEVVE